MSTCIKARMSHLPAKVAEADIEFMFLTGLASAAGMILVWNKWDDLSAKTNHFILSFKHNLKQNRLLWLTKYAGSVWVWQVVLGFFLAWIVVSQSTRWAARDLTGSEERHHERLFRAWPAPTHQTHPCGWQRPVCGNKISAFYHLTYDTERVLLQ